jgi:hypothetical protein
MKKGSIYKLKRKIWAGFPWEKTKGNQNTQLSSNCLLAS